jgi:hypothetical protein
VNAKEIGKAMRYVAPDAIFINPIREYTGRAAIRGFLRRGASEGIVYHHTNFRADGGSVVYDVRVEQYGSIVVAGTGRPNRRQGPDDRLRPDGGDGAMTQSGTRTSTSNL